MKYSIPYTPGLYDIILNLSDDNRKQIHDIYFSDNKFASNRKIKFNNEYWDELKKINHEFDITLHYVVNPSVYENDIYKGDDLRLFINLLWSVYNSGCTMLTFNNSFLMRMKEFRENIPPFTIKPSVNNKIASLENVEFYYNNMGITDFILDRSLNRNFDEIQRIYGWTKNKNISLTLLANEGCLPNCVWKQHCDNLISQYNKNTEEDQKHLAVLHTNNLCGVHYKNTPQDCLKSPFIPPNAIQYYEGIIDVIKIAGRMVKASAIEKIMKMYMNNQNHHSMHEFLLTYKPIEYQNIHFSDLEDNNFSEKTLNCKNKCSECNFCDLIFKKIIEDK